MRLYDNIKKVTEALRKAKVPTENRELLPFAKKGNKIICSACHKAVYEFTRDVYAGETKEASQLRGINGFDSPHNGEAMICPNCSEWLVL